MPQRPRRVLDLFSGLGGWSKAFVERGHDVTTVELEGQFNPTIQADILTLTADDLLHPSGEPWDIILASPPCECFSVMSIGRYWNTDHTPKDPRADQAMILLQHTVDLINALPKLSFIIENPRGKMRKMPMMQQFERRTVTYCQYGETRMKPTDLWGGFPSTLTLKPICKNGAPCHEPAPRGSATGTQGIKGGTMQYFNRSLIPYQLSLVVCEAVEQMSEYEETGEAQADYAAWNESFGVSDVESISGTSSSCSPAAN